MLEIYIEALLIDEDLTDQVWEAWDQGEIDDELAMLASFLVAATNSVPDTGDIEVNR